MNENKWSMNLDFSDLRPEDKVVELSERIQSMRNCKNCKFGWSTEECILPDGECIGLSEWMWMDEEVEDER